MEEPRAWPVLDLPGSCRAELASPAPKAGPRRSLSHPARLVYGRCSGQGCCPEAQTRTGWVLNGRAFVADQADFEGVIRFPADHFGWTGLGHQWKFVPVRRSWLSSSMQRWAMTASRSASVAK